MWIVVAIRWPLKYDPMGNRVWKQSLDGQTTTPRKYIVDINGDLPVILCELDGNDPNILTSSYFYADAQILAQRDHTDPQDPNFFDQSFYVHDRLGSVRLVVVPSYDELTDTWSVNAANAYTYTPFGDFYQGQCAENIDNPFKFTGQWHDAEIDQYYLRARMYDPAMMRFTGRDPALFQIEPVSLHRYLYCWNEPVSRRDINGRSWETVIGGATLGGISGALGGFVGGFLNILITMDMYPEHFENMTQEQFDNWAANELFNQVFWGGIRGTVAGGIAGASGHNAILWTSYGSFFGNASWGALEGFTFNSGASIFNKLRSFADNLKGMGGIPRTAALSIVHAVEINSMVDSIANGDW